MFFRRMLERRDSNNGNELPSAATLSNSRDDFSEDNESVIYDMRATPTSEGGRDSNNNNHSQSNSNEGAHAHASSSSSSTSNLNVNKMQRRVDSSSMGAVQLTPLWEHILRTRRLPETICPASMFAEFHERLQDPEWQVRQHALRVLVDVLVVLRAKADKHMELLTTQLVENLGHQAPTVRKGALDCLRVYLAETAMPETVMLHILESGLGSGHGQSSAPLREPHGGRLSCGVLLSLPALLQSILHTPQRHFIVRHAMERLVGRMGQLLHQEITLKVMAKLSELLGVHEFDDYMEQVGGSNALSQYAQLCQVYGISAKSGTSMSTSKTGAWRALPREHNWRGSAAPSPVPLQPSACPEKGKVIMETEIKINDDTLTMRILEADTETEEPDSPARSYETTELVCRQLPASAKQQRESVDTGILQVISDSEVEEQQQPAVILTAPNTPSRGLKRVTFGGEVVKMRTPDSDAASSSNNNSNNSNPNSLATAQSSQSGSILALQQSSPSPTPSPMPVPLSLPLQMPEQPAVSVLSPPGESKTMALSLDIPSDNTKPLARPQSSRSSSQSTEQPTTVSLPSRQDSNLSLSPRSPAYRSRSISPAGSHNVSPKLPHKQIEVLHNLQLRDPSPRSQRRSSEQATPSPSPLPPRPASNVSIDSPATPKNWEDLDIVNYKTLMDLRSGDWRNRLQGIAQLELALQSSSNLAQVQPYLDSLLRTLLSSERNYEVAEEKRELLVNLITRLPLDNLEERTLQILTGLSRQGNAGANRVCKALMQRLPAGTIVAKLTAPELLHAKSSKFRDHALQMSIYALMSFPSTCFDINNLTAQVTYAALNRKRRVRQAALEVLAVLAEISSAEQVLGVVTDLAANLEPGPTLLAAVKTRLARRQLPLITPDGAVLYTLHQADEFGAVRFGPDVAWITQGEGSASPNAIKRRRMRAAAKKRQESTEAKDTTTTSNNYHSDESLQRHSFHSPPEAIDLISPTNDFSHRTSYGAKKNNGFQTHHTDRRLVAKACSETPMDGRSTDSTATTCSSGSGSFIQLTPRNAVLNRGLARQNSRFPAMNQQMDFVSNFMRNVQRAPYQHYGYEGSTGMESGAYPKVNYTISKTQKQKLQQQQQQQLPRQRLQHQHSFTQQSQAGAHFKTEIPKRQERSNSIDNLQAHYSLAKEAAVNAAKARNTSRSSSPISNIATTKADEAPPAPAIKPTSEGSPLSVKSISYSQKSTASAKSSSSSRPASSRIDMDRFNLDTEVIALGEAFTELIVDNIEEEEQPVVTQDTALKRNESISSLHSKTESIKTQLEDNTPQLSRAQSMKSLAIEEEIEESNSFVVVEAMQQELESTAEELTPPPSKPNILPSHDDLPINSRSLSLDSLYGRPASKQSSLDNTSTTTDSQSGSHLDGHSLPAKAAKHLPLKMKSKTSYLLRNQRRVSPAKQAVKLSQSEPFSQTMSSFEKPREALAKTYEQLDNSNWEVNMTGLQSTVRMIRFHADYLDHHMHMTCIHLTRSVRNLRSQVARAACQAAGELFALKSKVLEQECDDLVCALLHRSADTNRFLRADATHALESMVDKVQPSKVLNILSTKGAQHQNALVRTTAAKLLFRLVERLGSDRIYAMGQENRNKFFVVGANLLLEGSLETRGYAKSLFKSLSNHASYNRLLQEVIPQRTFRNVEKTLRSISR